MQLTLELSSDSNTAQLLMLQGKPIGEPLSQSGPFVMNTPEEVEQAELDYGETQFGGWPWPRRDMVFNLPSDARERSPLGIVELFWDFDLFTNQAKYSQAYFLRERG